ncbi:hypothetical protein TH53_21820 [Pedobacter lusitanus]|uniref:Helix-turn-helix domain-containing protein n=1 Tax=Pedobacter lusitanus TaxID=1503925 RepID=A0A0D0GLG4_9SPHI|nr:helix-turn-helix domain-containing protein [Pedobacter lusitanus]KIO75251.1 hypothetical protein TH53_21820 [Pedobacter lusitanus]
MEVITIESEAFKEIQGMHMQNKQVIADQAATIAGYNIVMISAEKAAELTGYSEKTLRLRKEEIGYHTIGKNIFFFPKDLEVWLHKYYRGPKPRKY